MEVHAHKKTLFSLTRENQKFLEYEIVTLIVRFVDLKTLLNLRLASKTMKKHIAIDESIYCIYC